MAKEEATTANLKVITIDNRSRGIELDTRVLRDVCGCGPRWCASPILPSPAVLVEIWKDRTARALFVETVPWWAVFLPRDRVWVLWNHEIATTYPFLSFASHILCKTRIAAHLAGARPGRPQVSMIGFTSLPQAEVRPGPPAASRQPLRVLHLGGQSPYKGTQAVLEAWTCDSRLPPLVVTCFGPCLAALPRALVQEARRAPHVTLHTEPVSEETLEAYLHEIPIHLAPSSAEGFGHTLNLSRLAGAVLITTQAEPMRRYGNLRIAGKRAGLHTRVRATDVAAAVHEAVALSPEEREEMGRANQQAFVTDHAEFQASFRKLFR